MFRGALGHTLVELQGFFLKHMGFGSVCIQIQVALRHKSEIEHHRNKIRLRAKRKGHYDFPSMEDIIAVFGDSSEQQRVYQQAQEQIHKILHPETQTPSPNGEPHRR